MLFTILFSNFAFTQVNTLLQYDNYNLPEDSIHVHSLEVYSPCPVEFQIDFDNFTVGDKYEVVGIHTTPWVGTYCPNQSGTGCKLGFYYYANGVSSILAQKPNDYYFPGSSIAAKGQLNFTASTFVLNMYMNPIAGSATKLFITSKVIPGVIIEEEVFSCDTSYSEILLRTCDSTIIRYINNVSLEEFTFQNLNVLEGTYIQLTTPNPSITRWNGELMDTFELYANEDITIHVDAINEYGCHEYQIFNINVYHNEVFIPNAFSPNNDGLNDIFKIATDNPELQIEDFYIFNRWGGIVFEGHDMTTDEGWKGDTSPGVYVYLIKVNNRTYTGTITLVK